MDKAAVRDQALDRSTQMETHRSHWQNPLMIEVFWITDPYAKAGDPNATLGQWGLHPTSTEKRKGLTHKYVIPLPAGYMVDTGLSGLQILTPGGRRVFIHGGRRRLYFVVHEGLGNDEIVVAMYDFDNIKEA